MPKQPKPTDFVLSDLHLGHDKILGFCRPWFKSIEEHDEYIINKINEICPSTEDYLWLLGDVAFSRKALFKLRGVKCKLALVGGNHDHESADTYLQIFEQIRGVAQMTYDKPSESKITRVLFTHIPMHPDQMRWDYNIHGHLHTYHVNDDRYINVCCEPRDFTPVTIGSLLDSKLAIKQKEDSHVV